MALLDDVKSALRISTSTTAFNTEVTDLISAAQQDLELSGVNPQVAADTTDPLIKRAIITYCKAHFGFNNPDADRLLLSYDLLKTHLTLSREYARYAITFEVDDGTDPIDEASVTFNGETKLTNASGVAVFYVREGDNYEYAISADNYESVDDNVDISANTTIEISLIAS